MGIQKVNSELCRSGCGLCVDECSYGVFEIDPKTGKAIVRYAEDCDSCVFQFFCLSVCPVDAIEYTVDLNTPLWHTWDH